MNVTNFISPVGSAVQKPILAAGSSTQNYFQNVESGFESALNTVIPFVWIAVAAAIVGIGLMCIVGSERSKEMAKSKFVGVVIGCALVIGAIYIAKGISNIFKFGS